MSCKCGADFASQAQNRILIQSLAVVSDDAGGRVEAWQPMTEVWAVIEPMAGREVFLSSQLQSRVDARMTIRYKAELKDTRATASYRVQYEGRTYNLKAIKNLADDMKTEGKSFQQLLCVEGEGS